MIHGHSSDANRQGRSLRRRGRVIGGVVAVALLAALAVVMLRNAWASDDAYITLRTVDNFVHGLGLRWNVYERVQAYTHPLWMFLLAAVYFFTRESYFTMVFLSLAVSMAAAGLAVWWFGRRGAAVFLVAVLASSKAFVDYTASGLETPLTYLLVVAFLALYLKDDWAPRRLLYLALVTALAGLTRLDLLIIFLPGLAYAAFRVGWRRSLGPLAVGLAPLVAWELFALLYYGSPVPNTAYAKLNTGVPLGDLAGQGLWYFLDSLTTDPLTLTVIAVGLAVALASRKAALAAIVAGVVLYLLYVVRVGGCFMSGRFFSLLVLLAAVLIVARLNSPPAGWVVLAGLAVLMGLAGVAPPLTSGGRCGTEYVLAASYIRAHFIADERRIYYPDLGLLLVLDGRRKPKEHIWAELGLRRRASKPSTETRVSIGLIGYYAGPRQETIDLCALADPLLARLPAAAARGGWRIGHFVRTMPDGYLESVRTRQNRIRDKDLAEYYDRLCLVTRGRLLDPARLVEIARFNLGLNDHLLRSYCDQPPLRATPEEINRSATQGGTTFDHSGLEIVLGGLRHAHGVEVRIEYGSYYFIPCRSGRGISSLSFWTPPQGGALATWRIDVPYRELQRGYDSILVVPIIEPGPRRIEAVRLLGEPGLPHAAGPGAEPAAGG